MVVVDQSTSDYTMVVVRTAVVTMAAVQTASAVVFVVQTAVDMVVVPPAAAITVALPFDGPVLSHITCQSFSPGVDHMHDNIYPHSQQIAKMCSINSLTS